MKTLEKITPWRLCNIGRNIINREGRTKKFYPLCCGLNLLFFNFSGVGYQLLLPVIVLRPSFYVSGALQNLLLRYSCQRPMANYHNHTDNFPCKKPFCFYRKGISSLIPSAQDHDNSPFLIFVEIFF